MWHRVNLSSLARKARLLDEGVSRMLDQDEAETARRRRRSRRVLLVIAALPVLATMIFAGGLLLGDGHLHDSTHLREQLGSPHS